ncbi:F-box protein CPR1-like [Lycium barbarum]|uniref:F-box protein CPR1-like n=1 Tax=Lycium barbarum TaxID=112863 RepID=UPI00293E8584|nr:F-box protein CPR1-like [Lycium barbarum]
MEYPLKPPFGSAKFLGSCNGLICLTTMSFKLMLWNPCTGNYKEFQDSFVKRAVSCYIRYGFGYDAINDDYKVVKIFSFPKDERKYENMVKIYSLRSNSWKMSESFSGGYINAQSGVILNEALHWEVSHCRGSGAHSKIMTLDLATETYGVMELPSCGNGNFVGCYILDRYLVACCNYYPGRTGLWP